MLAPLDHLGGQVIERAAQGVAAGGRGVDGPTEVGDLHVVLRAQEEIFRLDVAVYHVLRVAVPHGRAKVGDEPGRGPFGECATGRELLVQLAPGTVFQYEVDVLVVVEVAVHAKDVTVAEVGLNLDLPTKLVLHAAFKELTLRQDLDGHDVLRPTLAGEVNLAELPPAERLPDFEVLEGPSRASLGGVVVAFALGGVVGGVEGCLRSRVVVDDVGLLLLLLLPPRIQVHSPRGGGGPLEVVLVVQRRGRRRLADTAIHGVLLVNDAEHGR